MARFSGKIGYVTETETEPGLYDGTEIVETPCIGDLIKNDIRVNQSNVLNPEIATSMSLSVIANDFMKEHMQDIRYVKLTYPMFGSKPWVVTGVNALDFPRLILSLGGVYNGPTN